MRGSYYARGLQIVRLSCLVLFFLFQDLVVPEPLQSLNVIRVFGASLHRVAPTSVRNRLKSSRVSARPLQKRQRHPVRGTQLHEHVLETSRVDTRDGRRKKEPVYSVPVSDDGPLRTTMPLRSHKLAFALRSPSRSSIALAVRSETFLGNAPSRAKANDGGSPRAQARGCRPWKVRTRGHRPPKA